MRSDARKRLTPNTTRHTQALALLEGARTAHTLDPLVADMIANTLTRHEPCRHHILGGPVCAAYDDALRVLGVGR